MQSHRAGCPPHVFRGTLIGFARAIHDHGGGERISAFRTARSATDRHLGDPLERENPPGSYRIRQVRYHNHKDRHLIGTAKDGKGLVSAMVDKRLDLGLLGPLEMSVDGAMVPLGTPKQRAVLAILLMNRNSPVGVDRLITALWEEWPPSGARANIHSYVSNLRKVLGAAGIDPRAVLRPRGASGL